MIKNTIKYFIDKPKVANLLLVFILLIGFINMARIQNSGYPTINFGIVNIFTAYPGASPEDVELKVSSKIEEEIKTIDGIKSFFSASVENSSQIVINLDESRDYDKTVVDIQKAIDRIEDFPAEVTQKPTIIEVDSDKTPVTEIAITGDASYSVKRQYALLLEKRLQDNAKVGSIDKLGYLEPEVKIRADQEKLSQHYVALSQIIQAIKNHNIRMAGGDLNSPGNQKKIVIHSEFEHPLDVGDVVIRSGFDGNRLQIKDVASISEGFEPKQTETHFNSKKSINLLVQKKPAADIVETAADIKVIVEEFRLTLPDNVEVTQVVDFSQEVQSLLKLVKDNVVLGFILVSLSVIIFLNFKVAIWTVLGIPISIFTGFCFFSSFGVTINFIS
ncbi:hypothetical protein DID80_06980, partial [Candidatus Marinamargulisbacteria bacterium SCGC AAA071-K20]